MFVNPQGWFVTAGHLFTRVGSFSKNLVSALPGARRRRQRKNQKVITHFTLSFAGATAQTLTAHVNESADIGVARMEGVVPPENYRYPQFRLNDPIPGEMLCRIGFPFLPDDRSVGWVPRGGFQVSDLFPYPQFVNEALVSRFLEFVGQDGTPAGRWIESSSPGLLGQSGGPLADKNGLVCGIQVNTAHYPFISRKRTNTCM